MHHAHLLVGEGALPEEVFAQMMKESGFSLEGNPDFFVYEEELLTVDMARSLGERALQKPFGDKQVFLVKSDKINLEAQNALLKVIEEPNPGTLFFLIVRSEGELLETLVSRMNLIRVGSSGAVSLGVEEFLALSHRERLDFAKNFITKEGDAAKFLDDIALHLKSQGKDHAEIGKIHSLRRYSRDRTVSARLVLEHLSLVL